MAFPAAARSTPSWRTSRPARTCASGRSSTRTSSSRFRRGLEFGRGPGRRIPKDPANREQDVYFDMIIYANRTNPAALDRAALRDEGLWAKVFHEPAKYRGQVLHFEGRLKRLRQYPRRRRWPSRAARGITTKDTCPSMPGKTTRCSSSARSCRRTSSRAKPGRAGRVQRLLLQDLPLHGRGHEADAQGPPRPAADRPHHHPTGAPAPAPETSDDGSAWSDLARPGCFSASIGLAVALLFLLGYWFRSGDRHVHGRVSTARYGEFVPPPADAPPDAVTPTHPPSEGQRER